MQKYCYACIDGKLTCIMDYKFKKKRDSEIKYCYHLSQGEDKETCEFYMTTEEKKKTKKHTLK
jgi:hypothetical protein